MGHLKKRAVQFNKINNFSALYWITSWFQTNAVYDYSVGFGIGVGVIVGIIGKCIVDDFGGVEASPETTPLVSILSNEPTLHLPNVGLFCRVWTQVWRQSWVLQVSARGWFWGVEASPETRPLVSILSNEPTLHLPDVGLLCRVWIQVWGQSWVLQVSEVWVILGCWGQSRNQTTRLNTLEWTHTALA